MASSRQPVTVIFADLDGTMRDPNQSWPRARPALALCRRLGVALVLVSSKTRAEMEPLHRRLGLSAPFVCENGGGVYFQAPAGGRVVAAHPGPALCPEGGRFHHLHAGPGKGAALELVQAPGLSLGLGDAPNDFDLLARVDLPALVASDRTYPGLERSLPGLRRTKARGAAGFNEAVLAVLESARDKRRSPG